MISPRWLSPWPSSKPLSTNGLLMDYNTSSMIFLGCSRIVSQHPLQDYQWFLLNKQVDCLEVTFSRLARNLPCAALVKVEATLQKGFRFQLAKVREILHPDPICMKLNDRSIAWPVCGRTCECDARVANSPVPPHSQYWHRRWYDRIRAGESTLLCDRFYMRSYRQMIISGNISQLRSTLLDARDENTEELVAPSMSYFEVSTLVTILAWAEL